MAPSTPANLVENSNNLALAVKNKHWTFSTKEDKFLCMVENCTSKGLEIGREEYVKSIVNAHRIRYESKAPQCSRHITHACASYAARHPELIKEIYNNDIEVGRDAQFEEHEE